MICKSCGKELILPHTAYMNLETYNVGGRVVASSECCGTGYYIKMNISYTTEPYLGERKTDDWGRNMKIIKS